MNIVLIGYRCSGKTSVGKDISKKLEMDFIDTDSYIESLAGCSIEEMVSLKGWEYFREMEKRAVEELTCRDQIVIATGGGVIMDEANIDNLKKSGLVVWLKGDVAVLRKRMQKDDKSKDQRPSLTGEDPLDEIKKVLDIRNPLYQKACDIEIDTSSLFISEISDLIIGHFK